MENVNNEYFELPSLIKHGDFNIRRLADKSLLPVEECISMLLDFLTLAPDVNYALDKFSNRIGYKEAYRVLDDMATILKKLMCNKFVTEFYSILDAYEKGNWRLAAVHAERMEEKFNALYMRVRSTKRTKRPEILPDASIPLREFIKRLEYEEANRKLVVLAVDDSAVILKSVSAVLSNEYKVFTLLKPKELENILQKITPDLFLLDYQMPEMNGFELVPVIRSFDEHKDTPIVFLTAEGTIDNVTAAIAMGSSDFIVKPFAPDMLREKIARHIVRKKAF